MRFLNSSARSLKPYTPGEQPTGKIIKLNTNESPYPPSPKIAEALKKLDYADFRLYPDLELYEARALLADQRGLKPENVFIGAGSDEILGYSFMAFCEKNVAFPDITYGFYRVYAELFGLSARLSPLNDDFTVNLKDLGNSDCPIILANPNAPTGLAVSPDEIECLLSSNTNRLLILDEAYADFCPELSCEPLITKYDNLLIVHTFSKAYGLAGMRLGAAYGSPGIIEGLNRMRFSFNPYNVNRVSASALKAAAADVGYLRETVEKIRKTRGTLSEGLRKLGFEVLPSCANFVFARRADAAELFVKLKEKGIFIRRFDEPRISDFLRISVGTDEQNGKLLQILEEFS